MIDHVSVDVAELERSARFYDALFFALGVRRMSQSDGVIAYGIDHRAFWLRQAADAPGAAGHVAIAARGRAAVEAAHEAGLAAGGCDDGPPGPRPANGPRYYAGYLRDPDGVRVEIVSGSAG